MGQQSDTNHKKTQPGQLFAVARVQSKRKTCCLEFCPGVVIAPELSPSLRLGRCRLFSSRAPLEAARKGGFFYASRPPLDICLRMVRRLLRQWCAGTLNFASSDVLSRTL